METQTEILAGVISNMDGKGRRNSKEGMTGVARANSMDAIGLTRDLGPNQVLWFPFVSKDQVLLLQ